MWYKAIAAAVLLLASGPALSHNPGPQPELDADVSAAQTCLTVGARAAWGAQARFLGAPATFKYIPEAPLRQMFAAKPEDMPADAIYVLDELDLKQRREYEEAAFFGWKQADRWVREGRERPEYLYLSALFYRACRDMPERAAPPAAAYNVQ